VDRDPIREYGTGLAVVSVTRSAGADLDPFLGTLRGATSRPVRVVVADTAGVPVPDGARVLRIGEDVGRAAAANRAVAALDLDVGWVVVADPRVRWHPGALDMLLAAAARHPRAGALGPRFRTAAGGSVPSGGDLPTFADELRGRIPTGPLPAGRVGWLSAACLLLRRAAWDSVDGFDPRYVGAPGPVDVGDVDLGDRLARAGWLTVHVPAALVEVPSGGSVGGAGRDPVPAQGILEPHEAGLRRYVHDRRGVPARVLQALAARTRRT
jgi:Predicted glycosyltransferases